MYTFTTNMNNWIDFWTNVSTVMVVTTQTRAAHWVNGVLVAMAHLTLQEQQQLQSEGRQIAVRDCSC